MIRVLNFYEIFMLFLEKQAVSPVTKRNVEIFYSTCNAEQICISVAFLFLFFDRWNACYVCTRKMHENKNARCMFVDLN